MYSASVCFSTRHLSGPSIFSRSIRGAVFVRRQCLSIQTAGDTEKLFSKILIANRGEIACRVIRTARKLGIKTVAVYSEADRNALHVSEADEAYYLGPAPSVQSYLRGNLILDIARRAGAEAVHPGYGFLSENAAFAADCEAAGLVFIGPPPSAMEAMGSKSGSKKLMSAAGVPVVPGYHGDDQSPERLRAEAEKIGYPCLIKAWHGGGGKAMKVVAAPDQFDEQLQSARREARAAFASDKLLVERYIRSPRHIEVQIFADRQGNVVHLFERDCSVQRRHQKIIEEAPAPLISAEFRQQLGHTAVQAARAVGYVNAGTCEFIVDTETQGFYFMEMNTRLQVEHPITEQITQQDLVWWQLRVAAGHPLPLSQQELRHVGHAFEARLYAENPANDFLPGSGQLSHLRLPAEQLPHVRLESGVREGDTVSVYYDPMIAKLVVWDHDRAAALRRLHKALQQVRIAGLDTNVDFLLRLSAHPEFAAGHVETGFIGRHRNVLLPAASAAPAAAVCLAAVYVLSRERRELGGGPWGSPALAGFRPNLLDTTTLPFVDAAGTTRLVSVQHQGDGYRLQLDGRHFLVPGPVTLSPPGELQAEIDGEQYRAECVEEGGRLHVFVPAHGAHHVLQLPAGPAQRAADSKDSLMAPMPGKVVRVLVRAGAAVRKGEALVVLESMKMEVAIRAPHDGVVKAVHCSEGALVDQKRALLTLS